MVETNNKIGELLQNAEFIQKLVEAKSDGEIKALFDEWKAPITDEQLKNLKLLFSEIHEKTKSLSQKELESIAGGGKVDWEVTGKSTAAGAIAGSITGLLGSTAAEIYKGITGKSEGVANACKTIALGTVGGAGMGAVFMGSWLTAGSLIE
ncbi:hypothetical protein FACS189465_0590 [Clostridia bacterium]|nr:hypothetical protein FACS189465_0590 [Clostridia bacterium]